MLQPQPRAPAIPPRPSGAIPAFLGLGITPPDQTSARRKPRRYFCLLAQGQLQCRRLNPSKCAAHTGVSLPLSPTERQRIPELHRRPIKLQDQTKDDAQMVGPGTYLGLTRSAPRYVPA